MAGRLYVHPIVAIRSICGDGMCLAFPKKQKKDHIVGDSAFCFHPGAQEETYRLRR
jgi:hypothetical protein